MSKSSERVKKWRKNTKNRLIQAMGGKCGICGYDRSNSALEFHHIDPLQKSFTLGSARGSIVNWGLLVEEAKKCVLLCSNCHREVHEGIAQLPSEIPSFLEEYENYKEIRREITLTDNTDNCPVCNRQKHITNNTCSPECRAIANRKVINRPSREQLLELIEISSYVQVGKLFGVSDNTIRKWVK